MAHLTAKELREALTGVDDDTIVCGIGHFGETLRVEVEGLKQATLDDYNTSWRNNKQVNVLALYYQDAGPDPD